jgi:dye decolorizing peroxidase
MTGGVPTTGFIPTTGVSRRRLFAGVGAGVGAGGVLGAAAGFGAATEQRPERPQSRVVPFHGAHQAGIETAPAAYTQLTALDIAAGGSTADVRADLIALLKRWTVAGAALTAGLPSSGDTSPEIAATGPAGLTVTVGFGPGLFGRAGLGSARPDGFVELPGFTHDALVPQRSNGDLVVQVGGDDPLIVSHAAARLQTLAAPAATVRWGMRGFRRGDTSTAGTTRNLFGQIDGTVNPVPGTADFSGVVWCGSTAPEWLRGGSIVVLRRIRMLLPAWEQLSRSEQEEVIGRRKGSGAPLSGTRLTDQPNLSAQVASGALAIAPDAHIRLAAPETNGGARLFRRPYSYDDGIDATGSPDVGQLFLAWQADLRTAFLPIQQRLDAADHLNDFTQAQASAVFAAPPGVQLADGATGGVEPGTYLGQALMQT